MTGSMAPPQCVHHCIVQVLYQQALLLGHGISAESFVFFNKLKSSAISAPFDVWYSRYASDTPFTKEIRIEQTTFMQQLIGLKYNSSSPSTYHLLNILPSPSSAVVWASAEPAVLLLSLGMGLIISNMTFPGARRPVLSSCRPVLEALVARRHHPRHHRHGHGSLQACAGYS